MDLTSAKPIDYLLIGHVTEDLMPDGSVRLGGTACYSGLTAAALGHEVGLVTSCGTATDLRPIRRLQTCVCPSDTTTSFRNIPSPEGRFQYMHNRAPLLTVASVPEAWRSAAIVHLGPVAAEIDPDIYRIFQNSRVCLTPQGWLRGFDAVGRVHPVAWSEGRELLEHAYAVVLSLEDLHNDESQVRELASLCGILVVTENRSGARVYTGGEARHFAAPTVPLVEDTGAGDIFAACFFHRLLSNGDPWEAACFAVQLSALSITRRHLDSIPTPGEIDSARAQAIY